MTHVIEGILNEVGIKINGNDPWDIKIHNPATLDRIKNEQSIGAGEAYMEGWWDCDQLDELFFRICRTDHQFKLYSKWKIGLLVLRNSLINQQSRSRTETVAKIHYNLGNRLYELMLGKSMAYTCGYWKNAQNIDEAELAKYDLVCKKLYLKPGEKVLEIGCGWGGLAKYMATNYDCEVVAMDIGEEPSAYAKAHCKGLPVTIYKADYRDTHIYNPHNIKFDKLVSVGVLEHVGYKNYGHLMNLSRAQIKEDGIFLLHSICGNRSVNLCDPWIDKYIFPHGMLPSLKQLGAAFENNFIIEDLHNFGAYYDKTLMAWHKNFNDHWPALKSEFKFDESFRRMMNYYLLSCAGSFRARAMQLWQFVLTPKGMLNGYTSIR